jgi:hypothetical protein
VILHTTSQAVVELSSALGVSTGFARLGRVSLSDPHVQDKY